MGVLLRVAQISASTNNPLLHYIYLFQFSELISLETIQVIFETHNTGNRKGDNFEGSTASTASMEEFLLVPHAYKPVLRHHILALLC